MISKRDVQLGKIALKAGMIEKDQLARCLALKKKLAKKGKKASLTTLLLKKEFITKDQLEEIVALHNERVGKDDDGASKTSKRSRRSKRAKAGDEPKRKSARAKPDASEDGTDEADSKPAKKRSKKKTSSEGKRSKRAARADDPQASEESGKSKRRSKRVGAKSGSKKRRSKRSAAASEDGTTSEVESALDQVDPALFQSAQTDDVETAKRRLIGCPECGKKYRVRKTQVGKRFKCRRCKYRVKVPKDLFERQVEAPDAVAVEEFVLASSDQTGESDDDVGGGAATAAATAASMVEKIGGERAPSIRELAKAAQNYKAKPLRKAKFGVGQAVTLAACLLGLVGIFGGAYYVYQSGIEEDARKRQASIDEEFATWQASVEQALSKVKAAGEAKNPQAIGGSLAELEIARAGRKNLFMGENAARATAYEKAQGFDDLARDLLVLKGNLVLERGGLRVGEAIADFQQAAELTPTHEPTLIALAKTRIFTRQFVAAADGLKALNSEGAIAMRGYALEQGDSPAAAAEAYETLSDPLGPVLAARAYVGGREFKKAFDTLGKAKDLKGADAAAAKIVGALILEGQGKAKQAIDLLGRAILEGGDLPYPRLHRGAMRLRIGKDPSAALDDIQKGNRLGATAWGRFLVGEAQLALLNLSGALGSYREAAQARPVEVKRLVGGCVNPFEEPLSPDYKVLARCRLGFYENVQGKLRAAKIECSKARNENPFSPYAQAALTHLDLLQPEVNLPAESEELIRRALDLSRRAGGSEVEPVRSRASGYLLLVYGGLLTQTSRHKEAVRVLAEAQKLDPQLTGAVGILQGEANKRASQATASRFAYLAAAKFEVQDPAYQSALKISRDRSLKPKRLLDAASALLLRNPYNAHAFMLRAQARVREKEAKLALDDMARAIAVNPQLSAAYRERAYLFLKHLPEAMRDVDEAGKDFDRAMALERDQGGVSGETFLGKARYHKAKLQPKDALRVLDMCTSKHPDFADAYGLRAGIHKAEGNDAGYKADLKRYRELTNTK